MGGSIMWLLMAMAYGAEFDVQARLLDETGVPQEGAVSVVARLYGNEGDAIGTEVWSDTIATTAEQGYVSLDLVVPNDKLVDTSLWLGLQVVGQSEMVPRQALRTVPAAHRADSARVGTRAQFPCGAGDEGGLLYNTATQTLDVCTSGGWTSTGGGTITLVDGGGGSRRWSDGTYAASCYEYRFPADRDRSYAGLTGSGLYLVDIDGGGATPPTNVYCDMDADGGGWTLVQRTVWDWASSSALLTDFATWRSTTIGTPASGAYRLAGARWPLAQTRGELMVSHTIRKTDGSSCSPLRYTQRGEVLVYDNSAAVSGRVGAVTIANNDTFSATDVGPSTSCVNSSFGVPWFYSACCSTCPTYRSNYWGGSDTRPMFSYSHVADLEGNVAADVCGGGTPVTSSPSTGFVGDDQMEIYVR